MDTKILKV